MKPKLFSAHRALTPMTPKTSPLTQESLLQRIIKIEEKLDLLSQVSQILLANSVPKSKTSKNMRAKGTKRVSINAQVFVLLTKYPDKAWTSDELAAKIGCSDSAVKKTSAWKAHQKQKNEIRQQCSIRKGVRDQNGNILIADEDETVEDWFCGQEKK
jgi:citrate synthase